MTRLTLALLAFAASGAAHATCIYPRAPAALPDGTPGFTAANTLIGRMARVAYDALAG